MTVREKQSLCVFKNRVVKMIFRSKRDEVTGDWRRLHNEELNDPYCSQNIIRMIKTRIVRWVGNVAGMEQSRVA